MNNKKTLLLASTLAISTLSIFCALLTVQKNPLLLKGANAQKDMIRYHLANDSSHGVADELSYTVTDNRTGNYYNGFVSSGTFTTTGLNLTEGEYFQADLKGATAVQITFTSGQFAVELSNDNANFSRAKYLGTNGTYTFNTLMRYVRVVCVGAGTLTDVNIQCECSDAYTYSTAVAMDNAMWTDAVKTNKLTVVGVQKGGNMDDLNYHNVAATRDNEGVYFYVTEKVSNVFYDTNNTDWKGQWFAKDNFEVQFNTTGILADGRSQLFASMEPSNCGNFDIVSIKTREKAQYDCFVTVTYKCFASYKTLSQLANKTYDESTEIYLWYGSRASDHVFDGVSFWNSDSQVKLTTNGIVNLEGGLYGTFAHREGDWGNTANWHTVTEDIRPARTTLATHVNGGLDGNPGDWGSYCWKGPLSILAKQGDLGVRQVFRLDWWGWADGNLERSSSNNGVAWADVELKATNGNTQFWETIIDCEVVYVFGYNPNNNMYTSLRIIFPNNPDVVTRGDYLLYQEVTTPEVLGAYINAEWTDTIFYNR